MNFEEEAICGGELGRGSEFGRGGEGAPWERERGVEEVVRVVGLRAFVCNRPLFRPKKEEEDCCRWFCLLPGSGRKKGVVRVALVALDRVG